MAVLIASSMPFLTGCCNLAFLVWCFNSEKLTSLLKSSLMCGTLGASMDLLMRKVLPLRMEKTQSHTILTTFTFAYSGRYNDRQGLEVGGREDLKIILPFNSLQELLSAQYSDMRQRINPRKGHRIKIQTRKKLRSFWQGNPDISGGWRFTTASFHQE